MAKRLGEVAKLLEKLFRDGYTFDETVAILQTNKVGDVLAGAQRNRGQATSPHTTSLGDGGGA